MDFIPEDIIEEIIQQYDDIVLFENDLLTLKNENPIITDFISEERLDLLQKDELAYLEFITLVIYSATKKGIRNVPKIKGNLLEDAEEKNYDLWENEGKKSLKSAFDVFFEGYPQEDLLAFLEDSLQQDEENPVTGVGAELIAVTAKSIIDVLHDCN